MKSKKLQPGFLCVVKFSDNLISHNREVGPTTLPILLPYCVDQIFFGIMIMYKNGQGPKIGNVIVVDCNNLLFSNSLI